MDDRPDPGRTTAPQDMALTVGVGVAVAIAVAWWDSSFHVVPTASGSWRGIADPPGALRLLASVILSGAVALILSRFPACVRRPFLALALAGLPLVPVLTGGLRPLLIFQGPMLRLLTGAVLAVSVVRLAGTSGVRTGRAPSLLLFAAAFGFYAAWGGRVPGAAGPQGDEPHYLVLTHSLLTDGDLDLTDEFDGREYAPFYGGILAPHTSPNSPPGKVYSMHSPGLPALLLPAYALGGYPGARLLMSALAALASVLIYRLVLESLDQDAVAAAAWALATFTPALPFYAVTLYPDTLAALATAAFLLAARRAPGAAEAATAALLATALPWVHTRLIPLAGLGLAFTLARPYSWRVRAAAAGAFLVSLSVLLAYFHAFYGQASFIAALGPPDVSPRRLPWGTAGLFLDRQYGLLTVAPVLALAFPGALILGRCRAGETLRAIVLALLAVVPAASYIGWWGGASPPARFVLPVMGPLMLLAAPALPLARDAVAALGGIGLALLGLLADTPQALRNRPDGESFLLRFLSPSLDLNGWLPSFVQDGWAAPLLAAALVATGALAWKWRWRGFALGLAAHAVVVAALGDRPLIDQRAATQRLLWDWDIESGTVLAGASGLRGLSVPFELPRRPWILQPGQVRNSRRLLLPPGAYRVQMRLRPLADRAEVRLGLYTGRIPLAQADLDQDRTSAAFTLLLPVGGRGLGVTATGVGGRAEIEEVVLTPEALVPRRRRGDFPWPELPEPDRYRLDQGDLRVTVADRSEREGDGFRLAAAEGSFLVDAAAGAVVEVRVRRREGAAPARGASDAVFWGSRRVSLGHDAESVLHLAMADGVDLGLAAVVPVRVRVPGAWVSFSLEGR